ncbi:hypothetical protein GCM10009868_36880 [Terrabacter aerolatus]|uniref:Flagellar assembly protein FliH/Type III secretion system HrpE domain-containing protein n=1 Tax=Terrabacter aerolatus TaxID=422442 RepID=A0A512CVS6_9MICO|nr:FliH/SctL family protein [Terrabacter aerolatus]GEO28329.1 hypothetical protein TAE01_01390 [Terrabacter aerolatus]
MSTDTARVAVPVVFPTIDPVGEAEGFTRGHAAGYAAGLRLAAAETAAAEADRQDRLAAAVAADRARTDRALVALDAAARALAARTAPVLSAVDAGLVEAALTLAEAVIGRELADGPYGARAALSRALSGPDAAAVVAVRLHPDDLEVLTADDRTDAETVLLVPDAGLERGDAVADYPDGELDARVRTALQRARAAVGEANP